MNSDLTDLKIGVQFVICFLPICTSCVYKSVQHCTEWSCSVYILCTRTL